ncbi:MAG: hypothetical protein HYV07_31450 [Deltaproteobacteria bacterium]|nr:hypothetical protein [Deltaproteobacteria bacterium]
MAVRAAIRRQREKARVAMPFRGFHVILPPEYRALGCLPAEQFVPQLMEHLGLAYYAGLLSAASLHGAAHQAPMVFQAVVAENRPEIRCGRVHVEFIARHNVSEIPIVQRNAARGLLRCDLQSLPLAGLELVQRQPRSCRLRDRSPRLRRCRSDGMDALKGVIEAGRQANQDAR